MESSRPEEDENMEGNIIKDVRNHFRLKKLKNETIDMTIKDKRNVFRLKKRMKKLKKE